MYCPTCNKEIADNALVCPNCKERVAEQMQSAKLAALTAKKTDEAKKVFNSPLFLVNFIFLAIVSLFGVIRFLSALGNGTLSIILGLVGALPTTFAIISAICAIKLFANKDQLDAGAVSSLAKYPKVMQVFSMIYTVISGIIGAVILYLVVIATKAINSTTGFIADLGLGYEVGEILDLIDGSVTTIAVIIFMLVAFVIAFFILSFICYKKINSYYSMLGKAVGGEAYNTKQNPPVVLSFICAVVIAIFGLILIKASFVYAALWIGIAGYLITGALATKKIKVAEDALAGEIAEAQNQLAYIHNETVAAIAAEERVAAAAQNQQQMQQQQMMQQMMAQMMAANAAAAQAAPAAPAAEPAAEPAAPTQE